MNNILHFIDTMLPVMLVALPIVIVVRLLRIRALKRRGIRTTAWRETAIIAFAVFCAGLFYITIYPRYGFQPLDPSSINLVPFRVFSETAAQLRAGNPGALVINFFGNIAMFAPLGFFPALLAKKPKLRNSILCAFGSSLLIELSQLFQPRSSDIDDLWLNALGGLFGFVLFWLLRRYTPKFIAKFQPTMLEQK